VKIPTPSTTIVGLTGALLVLATACGTTATVSPSRVPTGPGAGDTRTTSAPPSKPSNASALALLGRQALTATVLGAGFRMDADVDSATAASPTPSGSLSPLVRADAGCRDAVLSINTNATTGQVAAAAWVYRDFVDSISGEGVTEWIGAYAGAGASTALANLSRDYATCAHFGLITTAQTVQVSAHPFTPALQMGLTASLGYFMTFPHADVAVQVGRYDNVLLAVQVSVPVIGTYHDAIPALESAGVHAVHQFQTATTTP
jgi:hypothetical protein